MFKFIALSAPTRTIDIADNTRGYLTKLKKLLANFTNPNVAFARSLHNKNRRLQKITKFIIREA